MDSSTPGRARQRSSRPSSQRSCRTQSVCTNDPGTTARTRITPNPNGNHEIHHPSDNERRMGAILGSGQTWQRALQTREGRNSSSRDRDEGEVDDWRVGRTVAGGRWRKGGKVGRPESTGL